MKADWRADGDRFGRSDVPVCDHDLDTDFGFLCAELTGRQIAAGLGFDASDDGLAERSEPVIRLFLPGDLPDLCNPGGMDIPFGNTVGGPFVRDRCGADW